MALSIRVVEEEDERVSTITGGIGTGCGRVSPHFISIYKAKIEINEKLQPQTHDMYSFFVMPSNADFTQDLIIPNKTGELARATREMADKNNLISKW